MHTLDRSPDAAPAKTTLSGCEFPERRSNQRFSTLVMPIEIWIDSQRRFQAEVLDESFGGMGLRVWGTEIPPVDAKVLVDYAGCPMAGRVAHVTPDPDGSLRIGLEWLDTEVVAGDAGL